LAGMVEYFLRKFWIPKCRIVWMNFGHDSRR
jgi:hypothetical protein